MAALTAPADAPEMPSIVSRPSSSRWSSTPQVNAPSAPPPCNARLMRLPVFGFSDLSPPKARERNSTIIGLLRHAGCVISQRPRNDRDGSLRHPTAINRVSGACDRLSCVTAQEDGERTNALRLGELMH